MKIRELIKANVSHTKRIDCPACGGRLTLTMTKENGVIKYNCFKAQCNVKGSIISNRTKEEIRKHLQHNTDIKATTFCTPSHIVNGLGTMESTRWARENNVIQAYENRLVNLSFDPKLERLLFSIKDLNGTTVGMVGRSISGIKPKWLVYPNSKEQTPFTCGKGSTLVIVEDCASACSVARVNDCTGMALLGTEFHAGYIPYIKKYAEIIVCLDDDAKRKAIKELINRLRMITAKPVTTMFTKEDLKRLPLNNLETMIGYAR